MGFSVGFALLLQVVVFFCNTPFVEAQVQLLNITDAPGLSATCIAVLNQAVNCTTTIASIGNVLDGSPVFGTPLFLTSSQLSGLCNTACSASLTTWERRIAGACGATLYDAADGGQYALALFAEQYVEAYSSVCLMNKAGAYCNRVIGDLMRIDPANQRATATPELLRNFDILVQKDRMDIICAPNSNNIYSSQYVGYAICVSNPGGNYVNPSPTTIIPSSTATSLWTYSLPAMTSYPNATYVASTADAPYANGTRMDCTNYFTAPILTNYTGNGTTSFNCQDAVSQFDIDMADFLTWNPSLSALNPCTMTNNTHSCVQKATAPPGYDCIGFTSRHGIDQDQFALWNPEVGSDCAQFKIGTQYCIDVLHYRQPGITSNCNKFVAANNTNWVELPCQIIETEFGISHARFIAWNPAVQDNCTGLYLGYDYCVSIPNYRPTYTSTTPFATALPSPAALPGGKSNAKGSSSSLPKGKATVTSGSSKSTKSNSLNRQMTVPTPTGK
ncbi:LysM domain-containing protein [Trichoderma harzianum]|uniref:LysM domain-containing protein n=1 Tax=Trichoderma harzianum TaxID=5544 RepID=A0A0F9XRZ0_TRIHA|nr:LysM domain-containing protein [Trichoderma harzianum]